jgi:aminoglycoside phosphotransferase (APT) family kinase protein
MELLVKESDWLDVQLERAQIYVNNGQADGSQSLLDSLIRYKSKKVNQTMIHGDCTTDNVLVVDGQVSLFIDVSGMTVGDPRYDESLAIRKMIHNPELLKAFYIPTIAYQKKNFATLKMVCIHFFKPLLKDQKRFLPYKEIYFKYEKQD